MSFSTESFLLSTLMSRMLLEFSGKFSWRLTIATLKTSAIVTWSLKTSSFKMSPRLLTWKLSTSVFQRLSRTKASREWRPELEHHTTSLLRCFQATTISVVICGLLVACSTSSFVDTHLSTVMITRRSSRWFRRVNSTLMVRNGTISQTMQRI